MAKKGLGLLLGAVVVTTGIIIGAKYATGEKLKNLQAQLSGLSVKLKGMYLLIDLSVYNPNRNDVNVQRFEGNVIVANKNISSITYNKTVNIPAGKTVKIKYIKATINALPTIFALVQDVFGGGGSLPDSITVQGTLVADGLNLPINQEFKRKS